MLSVIVSLSRKLSNVPSMFLLTSQLTNSTPPSQVQNTSLQSVAIIGQALRPIAFTVCCRETLKIMAE